MQDINDAGVNADQNDNESVRRVALPDGRSSNPPPAILLTFSLGSTGRLSVLFGLLGEGSRRYD